MAIFSVRLSLFRVFKDLRLPKNGCAFTRRGRSAQIRPSPLNGTVGSPGSRSHFGQKTKRSNRSGTLVRRRRVWNREAETPNRHRVIRLLIPAAPDHSRVYRSSPFSLFAFVAPADRVTCFKRISVRPAPGTVPVMANGIPVGRSTRISTSPSNPRNSNASRWLLLGSRGLAETRIMAPSSVRSTVWLRSLACCEYCTARRLEPMVSSLTR